MSSKEKAAERVQEILEKKHLGPNGVTTVLLREGFSQTDIDEATKDIDWVDQGVKFIQFRRAQAKPGAVMLPVSILGEMWANGFSSATADAAMEKTDLQDDLHAILQLPANPFANRKQAQDFFRVAGYPAAEVDAVMEQAGIDEEALCTEMTQTLLQQGVSRRMLQDHLIKRGFPKQTVRQVIRDLKPDWKQQAVIAAEEQQLMTAYDEEARIRLMDQGFTPDEAAAATSITAFGTPLAVSRLITVYMQREAVSPEQLENVMLVMGYSPMVYQAVFDEMTEKADWTEAGAQAIVQKIKADVVTGGPKKLHEVLLGWGYTKQQINRAFELLDVDWPVRARQEFTLRNAQDVLCMDSPASLRKKILEAGYDKETAQQAAKELFDDPDDENRCAYGEITAVRSPLGYSKLREELEKAKYSPEAVDFALSNIFYDWNDMAAVRARQKAAEMLEEMGYVTPAWLRAYLTSNAGFTSEQADYALKNADIDWAGAAAALAEEFGDDAEEIRRGLDRCGFSSDLVESVVAKRKGSRNE